MWLVYLSNESSQFLVLSLLLQHWWSVIIENGNEKEGLDDGETDGDRKEDVPVVLNLKAIDVELIDVTNSEADGEWNQDTESNTDLTESTGWSLHFGWSSLTDKLGAEDREAARSDTVQESSDVKRVEVVNESQAAPDDNEQVGDDDAVPATKSESRSREEGSNSRPCGGQGLDQGVLVRLFIVVPTDSLSVGSTSRVPAPDRVTKLNCS